MVNPAHVDTPVQPPAVAPARSPVATVVGLLLALPALVLLITDLVLPALQTLRWSFQSYDQLSGRAEGVGTRNYEAVADDALGGRIGSAIVFALLPLLAVLVVAPLLAFAANRGGRAGRWATRGVLVLPLAAFAPVAVALSAVVGADDPASPPSVRAIFWLGSFGVTVALGVTAYLAVLRRSDPAARPWRTAIVVGAIAAVAVLAAAVQEFTSATMFRGRAKLLSTGLYEEGFFKLRFGTGAAFATVMLAILVVLGLGVGLLIVLSGLRLEFDDEPEPARPRQPLWWAVAGVLLLIVLVVFWAANGEWLGGITTTAAPAQTSVFEVLANTWLPTFVSTLIGVAVTALAAVGISGLRPLGRHSEWLLMPFAPFLFVGIAPLVLARFDAARAADRLDTFAGAVTPLLPVLVLFGLAVVLRGQMARRDSLIRAGRPPSWVRTLLPVLPLLGVAFLATWVVRAQDLMWPTVSDASPTRFTGPVAAIQYVSQYSAGADVPYGLILPAWLLVLLLLIGVAAQVFYFDRVVVRTGRPH